MQTKSSIRLKIIEEKLITGLSPTLLKLRDESHLHQGHAGALTGLGHFALEIASPAFANKSTVQCHRLIYAALGELMQTDIHALSITIK